MNDYLNNLVARTLGQMETVQPRLASRFEPVELAPNLPGSAPPLAARATDFSDFESLESAAETLSETPARTGRQPHRRARLGKMEDEAANDVATPPAVDSTQAAGNAVSLANPPAPPLTEAPASFAAPNAEPIVAPPAPPSAFSPPQQPDRAADLEKFWADFTARQQPLPAAEMPRAEALRPMEPTPPLQQPEPTDHQSPPTIAFAAPRPPIDARPATLAPVLPPMPAVERAPVIKVTIGRVEVRAVMNAPAASVSSAVEKAPPLQALPLHEYLRRRSHGEL